MMHIKKGENRQELMMMSYDMMTSPGNPVRLIDLMCKKFISDNPWREEWKGSNSKGCKSYPPGSLLSLLVYGYFNKINSSRNLEKETQRNIEVLWLMEGLQPDHWTICAFRRENKKLVKELLKSFPAFLLDQKYASPKRLVFDGSKLKAYANRNMLTNNGLDKRLENLDKSIAEYLSQLEHNDTNEDELESAREEIEKLKHRHEQKSPGRVDHSKHLIIFTITAIYLFYDSIGQRGINHLILCFFKTSANKLILIKNIIMMNKFRNAFFLLLFTLMFHAPIHAQTSKNGSEVVGRWDLTITMESQQLENLGLFRHGLMDAQGFPGWLEIKKSGFSTLVGYYVGYEGSARPISEIHYSAQDQKYHFTIPPQWMDIDDIQFEFTLKDDKLMGYKVLKGNKLSWTGVRAPSLTRKEPPVWGSPKNLLDRNMSRWIIPENNKFRMVDGVLVNTEVGGNLVTKEKFDDFKLSVEFRYPKGSNSGIYLRGRYELQIADGSDDLSDMSIGSIYGFIEPAFYAGAKPDEWQTFEITLVGRHITLVHNGIEVISNRPIPGITGGSLNSREGEPGPLLLQGDHGPVEFRKLIITPAIY